MESQRSAVVELHRAIKSVVEILTALKFPKSSRNLVYRTIKRFNEIGDVKYRARSGRPRTQLPSKWRRKFVHELTDILIDHWERWLLSSNYSKKRFVVLSKETWVFKLQNWGTFTRWRTPKKSDWKEAVPWFAGSQLIDTIRLSSQMRRLFSLNRPSTIKMKGFLLQVLLQPLRMWGMATGLKNPRLW